MVYKPDKVPRNSKGGRRSKSHGTDDLASPRNTDLEKLISTIFPNSSSILNPVPGDNYRSRSFNELTSTRHKPEFGSNTLKLLLIEPHFLFTYWEITDQSILDAGQSIGTDAKLTLRYYDTTESIDLGNCKYWDIEIFDSFGKWYLRLERPNQRLHLEIGLKDRPGALTKITSADFLYMSKEVTATPGPHKWIVAESGSMPTGAPINKSQYVDADPEILKRIMGPYFFDILTKGHFPSIVNSSTEALFPIISEPSSK